jgi:hypothetical protein
MESELIRRVPFTDLPYVRRTDKGFGGLALAGKRTGGMRDSCDHRCLAIFTSVAETGDLEAAEVSEARRPGTRPGRAGRDVLWVPTPKAAGQIVCAAR